MSSPNPLIPQGSLLEQQAKSKSTFHVAALIVGLHVFLLGGLLIIGCKREEPKPSLEAPPITDSFAPAPLITETNLTDPAYISPPAGDWAQTPTNAVPPVTYEPPYAQIPPPATELPAVDHSALVTSEYEVKKGDIAGRIASRNHITLKQMQEANPGVDLSRIRIGQKLNLPASAGVRAAAGPVAVAAEKAPTGSADVIAYTVKGGDTLTRLAKKHGTTIKAIRAASGLKSNDIKIGQKIKIPVKGASAATAPAPASNYIPESAPIPLLPTATPIAAPVGGPTP